jgi:hypothetical protein
MSLSEEWLSQINPPNIIINGKVIKKFYDDQNRLIYLVDNERVFTIENLKRLSAAGRSE